jgi:hypothetical protein
MYVGYIFVFNSTSFKDCVKNKRYTCVSEQVAVAEGMEIATVIFLYVSESNKLIGPFTFVNEKRSNLQPGTWTSRIDRSSLSGNIKVEREELHELKNAHQKFVFLKDLNVCTLSQSQIQEMLDALKESPRLQSAQ